MARLEVTMTEPIHQVKLFEPFDGSKGEEMISYFERFELYCETMEIKPEKAKLILSSIGGEAYSKLKTLVTPKDVRQCSYVEIKAAFGKHYNPSHLIVMERHNFRERKQKEEEPFRDFLADLKKLSLHCGFGSNLRLEEELIEQIVRGIRNDRLRAHFLSTSDLTLDRVINKVLAEEKAKCESDILKTAGSSTVGQVSKINPNYNKKSFVKKNVKNFGNKDNKSNGSGAEKTATKCYRYGKVGHPRSKCLMDKNVKCYNCSKTGHVAKVCRLAGCGETSRGHSEANFVYINTVANKDRPSYLEKICVSVQINNRDCIMEVDTGSPVSIMSRENLQKIAPHINKLERVHTTFMSYTKDKIPI